jgi:hypothetical protein
MRANLLTISKFRGPIPNSKVCKVWKITIRTKSGCKIEINISQSDQHLDIIKYSNWITQQHNKFYTLTMKLVYHTKSISIWKAWISHCSLFLSLWKAWHCVHKYDQTLFKINSRCLVLVVLTNGTPNNHTHT